MENIHCNFTKTRLLCDSDDFGPESFPFKALCQRYGFQQRKNQVWISEFLTPAFEQISFMCRIKSSLTPIF